MKHWSDALIKYMPCRHGLLYAKRCKSIKTAWRACPYGDWMLWLIERTGNASIVDAADAAWRYSTYNWEPAAIRQVVEPTGIGLKFRLKKQRKNNKVKLCQNTYNSRN
jgi:hypothetical protein